MCGTTIVEETCTDGEHRVDWECECGGCEQGLLEVIPRGESSFMLSSCMRLFWHLQVRRRRRATPLEPRLDKYGWSRSYLASMVVSLPEPCTAS